MCEQVGYSCTFALVELCQHVIGEILFDAAGLDVAGLSKRFASVPRAGSFPDASTAATVLLRFIKDLGTRLHLRLHTSRPVNCAFSTNRCVPAIDIDPSNPSAWCPAEMVASWARRFTEEVGRTHDLVAERARVRLLRNPAERLSLAALARDTGASVSVIRRRFVCTIGETPLEYRTRVRVRRVVELIRQGWKMDAIAADTGWRTRKDVYHAVQAVTGLKCKQIRAFDERETHVLLGRIDRGVGRRTRSTNVRGSS
ncbi:MAG TPA: helix-turn-helix domain-containing protein [Vicinamibacterales bacterium]|nr:helix-turn-helix domain-containing protein [Vicinamibacterales bacterium]